MKVVQELESPLDQNKRIEAGDNYGYPKMRNIKEPENVVVIDVVDVIVVDVIVVDVVVAGGW